MHRAALLLVLLDQIPRLVVTMKCTPQQVHLTSALAKPVLASHRLSSCCARLLCAPLLLTRFTKVTKGTHSTVAATFCVQECTRFAVASPVTLRANCGKVWRAKL